MIIVKLQGGLGNQMFQCALGLSLSKRLQTTFQVDTTFLEARFPQKNYTFREYELNNLNATYNRTWLSRLCNKTFLKYCIHPYFWKLIYRVVYLKSYISENQGGFISDFPDPSYLDGYWQDPTYFNEIRAEIIEKFTVITPISDENQAVLDMISLAGDHSVSVHVRRGDYVTNSNASSWHGTCNELYYKSAIEIMNKKLGQPKFFVFSDDVSWVKSNMEFPENALFIEHNGSRGHEDLRLMYHCSNHVIANSSFSWWGAWLAKSGKQQIVIAPKKWLMNSQYDTTRLIPDNWLKL